MAARKKTETTEPGGTNGKGPKMTISGSPEEIKEGLESFAGEQQEPERGTDPKFDAFIEALGTPGYHVEVRRIRPTVYPDGSNAKIRVYTDECPADLSDIKQNVFSIHGGHRYKVAVKDENEKMVAAHMIWNPETEEPTPLSTQEDPTVGMFQPVEEDEDYYDEEIKKLAKEEERLQKKQIIEEKKQRLAELQGKKDIDPRDDQIRKLQDQLADLVGEKKDSLILSRLEAIERRITEPARPAVDPEVQALKESIAAMQRQNEELRRQVEDKKEERLYSILDRALNKDSNAGLKELAEAIRSSNENALLSEIKALRSAGNKPQTIEEQLSVLAKLKEVLGDTRSKESRITEAAMDMLLDKALGGGGGGEGNAEEDPFKFAIKEMVPAVKELIQDQVEKKKKKEGGQLTRDQYKEIYKQATRDVIAQLRQQGAIKQAPPQQAIPQPTPAQQQQQQPAAAPSPQPQAAPSQPPQQQAVKRPGFQDEKVKLPPSPQSPAYDRKVTLNFVVDEIVGEIQNGPSDDTFIVGDAVDGLDDEFLDELCGIDNSDGLYNLIRPYVVEEKLKLIESRAKADQKIKAWLNRIITSIQYEYQQSLEGGEDEAPQEESSEDLFAPSEPGEPEQEEGSGFQPE